MVSASLMRIAGQTACAGEERLSMSAAELNEFLAAMEIVRQANAALLDVASTVVDEDRDERIRLAEIFISATIH
jgi:pilus assembly protein TadC